NSLHKKLPRSPTRVSILREINLGDAIRFEELPYTFDQIKRNAGNFMTAQPFHNCAPLKRSGQREKFVNGERRGMFSVAALFVDERFFFGCDRRRAPDRLSNVATYGFLQIWNDSASNPIAHRNQIFIRRVLAKLQPACPNETVDILPPGPE